MEITQNLWGFTPGSDAILLYTMRNASGAEVTLTNIGAAIVGVKVPDSKGVMKDVALGYKDFMSYFYDGPASGKTIGRYANRIANGRFSVGGKNYVLAQNNGPNALHGGIDGFGNRVWQSRVETDRLVFSLLSVDGDQGYPGDLNVEVVYDWDDECNLEITYFARTDKTTIINLTNHCYFNLAGEDSGSVLKHTLQINAQNYLPTDATQIPTGETAPVKGTPMDFRKPKAIGKDIDAGFEALKIGRGYDHCWPVEGFKKEGSLEERIREIAVLADPVSGRSLIISSTQPAAQVYTGNWLKGCPTSKSGHDYQNRDGIAIECQGIPDAPNQPNFPSQVLQPGELYNEKIVFSFRK